MKRLLIKALKNAFDMDRQDAVALAQQVEEVFAGNQEIEDMDIDKYTRSLFYELQRKKLLKLRREEIKEQGKPIRKYYWSFDDKKIQNEAHRQNVIENSYEIYNKIPRKAWLLHSTCNT
jgi:predicted transcriptional regulator